MKPLVSCLMVTAGRPRLAERAVQCFLHQTWPNRELVIVDDGAEDYSPMLRRQAGGAAVRYHRIERRDGLWLGGLRNVSLDLAQGDYCTQWDDDEWYHPLRIEAQMDAVGDHGGASVLRETLMHLATPEFLEHPYRSALRSGTPGTLLHERTPIRYPNVRWREDSMFRDALRKRMRVEVMDGFSHLFIRCFHGANTWDREHFVARLRYTMRDKIEYAYARYVRGDLFWHSAFRLTAEERASARAFFEQSRALGLF